MLIIVDSTFFWLILEEKVCSSTNLNIMSLSSFLNDQIVPQSTTMKSYRRLDQHLEVNLSSQNMTFFPFNISFFISLVQC